MTGGDSLVDREFIGTVLPNKDTMHQGKYKVNIPELQPHMKETEGVWCKNHTHRWRITPSQNGVCGSYYPLQPGMSVIVKFFANHIESAYVDRIISDAYPQTLPYEIIERDEYYQIIRTPKHNNIIAIYEGDTNSKNVPKNSIHIYFNNTRTTIVIDETGINIKTDDNINTTVAKNVKITVSGTADIKVSGNTNIETSANANIKAAGTVNVQAGGDANVKAGANLNLDGGAVVNIKGGSAINLQAPAIALNGTAAPAAAAAVATPADLPILITLTDYEYFTRSSGS
jgi:hypothetical protein